MCTTFKTTTLALCVLTVAILVSATQGQSPDISPAPGPGGLDCFSYLINMSDCLTFVEAGSNLSKPERPCCQELARLVDSQPICLCQLLGNSNSFGVQIDLNKALKLPAVCNVTTPDISLCSAVGVPVGVHGASGPGPSPSPSLANPSAGDNGNGASSIVVINLSFLSGLAIGFLTAFF